MRSIFFNNIFNFLQ